MEEMHQQTLEQMIKSAEGSAGLAHKITKPTPLGERSTDLGEKKRMRGYQTVVKRRGKNGQCIGNAMRKCRIRQTKPGGMRS